MFDWLKKMAGIAPPRPGSREHARKILSQAYEAYRLARRDRPRSHNQPHGYSGDAAVIGSHDLMHRRTRDLVRNVAQAKKIQRAFTNLVVGKGFQTFSWPFLPAELLQITTELETLQAGALGPRLQFALEADDLFDQYYSEKGQFDAENRLSGPEMYRMLMSESVVVGNGLMVRVFRRDFDPEKHLVPVCWQLFEREQLDESMDRPAGRGMNRIVGGIEFNDQNQAVRYYLWLDHPHDFFGVSQTSLGGAGVSTSLGNRRVAVDASRVIDLAVYDRPSSSLGHSWFDASGQSIWDRDSYTESEMRSAAVESAFILVAKLLNGEKYGGSWGFADDTDDTDEQGNREFKVGYSPVAATIGKDEEIEMVRAQRPNRDCPPFIKIFDRDISGGVGLSYYTVTGDYEATNFSSTRAAKLDEDLDLAPIQQWFGVTVALPVRRTFNALAAAFGRYQSIRPAEFNRNQRTYQRFDVIANGRDLLDPYTEGEARTARLRTGLSTFKEECARRNQHWIRILMQRAIEKRVFELFGVDADWTKSGTGNTDQGSNQQQADQQAEEIANRVAMLLRDRV